ncbi:MULTISPECIES: YcgN family cysteine cluster protein [Methylomonas]|uniref:YcgN family cysteine cluster protein n=1 Tax=Methylomonas TaxID=416 RepID=UPI00123211C4|nr:YcgN family cysteine cluster protein [Methylomonas rhizoryzae]
MNQFWMTKPLSLLTMDEWESLCDGCGKCCLVKLEDEETGEIAFTNVVCNFIDLKTCKCTCYDERTERVPECIDLKQHDFSTYNWLPSTCAYRLLSDGKSLPNWHPLLSGTKQSVIDVGATISGFALKEDQVDDLQNHIVEWLR